MPSNKRKSRKTRRTRKNKTRKTKGGDTIQSPPYYQLTLNHISDLNLDMPLYKAFYKYSYGSTAGNSNQYVTEDGFKPNILHYNFNCIKNNDCSVFIVKTGHDALISYVSNNKRILEEMQQSNETHTWSRSPPRSAPPRSITPRSITPRSRTRT